MAMDAKAGLLNRLEKLIGGDVTAEAMPRILIKAADLLAEYDVRELPAPERDDGEDDLLACYMAAMEVKGLSRKTIYQYGYVMRRMLRDVKVRCRNVTVYHLRSWLAGEQRRGISLVTLKGYRQVFTAFFGWLYREGLLDKNPAINLDPIRVPKKKKKIFSQVELYRLRKAATESPRDLAIISFLESSACRVSEMCGLDVEDVDLERGEVVVRGKGNKERTVMLSEIAVEHLRMYLMDRPVQAGPLFLCDRGRRLEPGGVRYILNQVAGRAGVKGVHPHKFRRTWATNACRHGMPIQEVCMLLGHERIETTMQYVVLNIEDLKNSYRKYA